MMLSTLILNASYEPLGVVPSSRAISLLLSERAVSLNDSPTSLHSSSQDIPIPWVIRLSTFVKVPQTMSRSRYSRRNIFIRDNHSCAYCGKRATTIDHVIPKTRGGQDSYENCVAACLKCNHQKGDKLLSDLNWELKHEPKAPNRFIAMLHAPEGDQERVQVWSEYISMFYGS